MKTNCAGDALLCSTKLCSLTGAGETLSDQDQYLPKRDQGMENEMKGEERSLSDFLSKDSVANQKRVKEMDFVGGNSNIPMVDMIGWGMDIMRKSYKREFFVKQTSGRKSFGDNTVVGIM